MNLADKERLRQWMVQICVIGMICLSITAPRILVSPSLPYFKIEQLLLPIVLAVYVWLLLAGVARTIRFNGLFVVGLLYLICSTISINYGASLLGHPVSPSDFYEFPKILLPVAFFTIAYEADLSESGLRRLLACFSFATLLVCLYAWGQFIGLGVTYKLNSYYSSGGHIDIALEYARRVYSTAGNANMLAALMVWSVILFTLAALFRVGNRFFNISTALASFVTLVMTGSRSGLLSVSFGFALLMVILSGTGRRSAGRLIFLILMVGIFGWTFGTVASSNQRTLQRFQTIKDPLGIDGLRARLDYLWPLAWGDISKSPIVGHGPGKSFLWVGVGQGGTIDSEYLDVIRQYGILGLLVFLGYYLYPLHLIRKGQRALRRAGPTLLELYPEPAIMTYFGFIMILTALSMDIWLPTFYSPFVQAFLWLWMGVAAGCARNLVGLSTELNMLNTHSVVRTENKEMVS